MKKLNIKRLVAIATGAALVGAAALPLASAAFTDLTKGDLVSAQGVPTISVVPGANAAVSDVVWSGNIAAKIAQLSTKTMSVEQGTGGENGTAPTDMTVNLTVGGTTTVSGAKEFKDAYLDSRTGIASNGAYEFGTNTSNAAGTLTGRPVLLGKSQIPSLYEATDTIRYNATDYSISVKEYIGLNADAKMEVTDTTIQDMVLYLNSEGDFNYTVNLGTGIYRYADTNGTTNFTDGDDDYQKVVLFGKKYLVQSVTNTSTSQINYVRLLEDKAKQTYAVGDTFTVTGKGGYAWAGQTLTVELSQVGQTSGSGSYQARFTLKDANGTTIDTRTTTAGNYVQFQDSEGHYIVKDTILLDTVLVVNTQDLSTATIDLYVGASTVDLYDGKGYPYDASNTNGPWTWKITLTEGTGTAGGTSDANKLLSISIANSSKKWDSTNPIYPTSTAWPLKTGHTGAVINLLEGTGDPNEGFAYVNFKGWEEKEATTKIMVGADISSKNTGATRGLYYKDTQGTEHYIPFYIGLALSGSGSSFTFDGKTLYYRTTPGSDKNFLIGGDNNTLNGVRVDFNANAIGSGSIKIATDYGDFNFTNSVARQVDLNAINYICTAPSNILTSSMFNCSADGNITFSTSSLSGSDLSSVTMLGSIGSSVNDAWYFDDNNALKTDANAAYRAYPIPLEGSNSQTYNYALHAYTNDTPDIWLLLNSQTLTGEYSKQVTLYGTDVSEDGIVNGADPAFYLPDHAAFGKSPSDYGYLVATLGLDGNGNSTSGLVDSNIYVDTRTTEGKYVAYPNNNLSTYSSDVNVFATVPAFYLRDETGYMKDAYMDYGSKYSIASGVFTAIMPQNRRYLDLIVGGQSTTQETTGGESNPTPLGVDETWTTDTGTKITITEITGTCAAGSGSCTPATFEEVVPLVQNLIYTDQSAPSGKVIIVGGYLINSLAVGLALNDGTTLEDALQVPGDYVAEKLSNGNIVVAGMTASDTITAAQELIDALTDLA